MGKNKQQKIKQNKSGASIIVALILMIVLLTIGTSVLTAATVSTHSVNNVLASKQLYYYARSVADTVTRGLTIEESVSAAWLSYLKSADAGANEGFSFTCTLSSTDLPEELRESDGKLRLEPMEVTVKYAPTYIDEEIVAVRRMTVSFVVTYQEGETYLLFADYNYTKPEEAGETGWQLEKYYQ